MHDSALELGEAPLKSALVGIWLEVERGLHLAPAVDVRTGGPTVMYPPREDVEDMEDMEAEVEAGLPPLGHASDLPRPLPGREVQGVIAPAKPDRPRGACRPEDGPRNSSDRPPRAGLRRAGAPGCRGFDGLPRFTSQTSDGGRAYAR